MGAGGALGRRGVITNPLYEDNEQEVDGLYDEVVVGGALYGDNDELVADYDEVGPAEEFDDGVWHAELQHSDVGSDEEDGGGATLTWRPMRKRAATSTLTSALLMRIKL
jgi:hypothetical protein